MIPTTEKSVEVVSNISADATGQFTVDEAALGHIMDVLTNLYSDPEQAVVREYLTNAYDAQIEAGMKPGVNWKPIQITTPSHFNKAYKIRDFGIGMNRDGLENIYSKYGRSTKTTSNDVVGMLGLGSKCALTYTNSFTITGYKDGIKTVAIISKNEENIPVFHIVSEGPTPETNGVEIHVPVKDRNSFAEKTRNFLKFWAEGLVLVDGQKPEMHGYEKAFERNISYAVAGEKVVGKSEVFIVPGDRYSRQRSYIVMGNVPYEVDATYVPASLRDIGYGFVAYVPMGAVSFPPSRETLFYKADTKALITTVSNGIFERAVEIHLAKIGDAPDRLTAFQLWRETPYEFQRSAAYKTMTYKGEAMPPQYLQFEYGYWTVGYYGRSSFANYSSMNLWDRIPRIGMIVTGADPKAKQTPTTRKKVEKVITDNGLKSVVLFVDADLTTPWLSHVKRMTLDEVKAIKLPRNTTVKTGGPTYEVWEMDASGVPTGRDESGTITSKKIAYVSPTDLKEDYRKRGTNASETLRRLPDGYALVVLATNRFEKFVRTYPHAETLGKVMQDYVDSLVKSASVGMNFDGVSHMADSFFKSANVANIDDPELQAVITASRSSKKNAEFEKAVELEAWGRRASLSLTVKKTSSSEPELMVARYPLIDMVGRNHGRHMEVYVNARYALLQD